MLYRFQNKALGDTIFRVGCDLMRKLSPEDRIIGALNSAIEYKTDYREIVFVLTCALNFRAKDEQGEMFPGDIDFMSIFNKGIDEVLTHICKFDKAKAGELYAKIISLQNSIDSGLFKYELE